MAATNERSSRSDWSDFVHWCVARGEAALPADPSVVVDYVNSLATGGHGATARPRVAAIRDAHREVGLTPPTDDERVRVAVTRVGWQARKPAAHSVPLEVRELHTIISALPRGIVGDRDRALLLVGYGAALRPSELVSLDVSDLVVVNRGLAVSLERRRVVIPPAPSAEVSAVHAWQEWVAAAGLTTGPAFRAVDRHGRLGLTRLGETAITRIVRRAAERAGLDQDRYTALSLRLGMMTTGEGEQSGGGRRARSHRA